jgi:ABC-type Fe3+/spermidine/putrescine transport system ATPase subunit
MDVDAQVSLVIRILAKWMSMPARDVLGFHEGAVLEVRSLRKSFDRGTTQAVAGVSFSVSQGEFLALLGPSGCGKTTTLRMIAGLEEPDGGDVLVQGRSLLGVPVHRRNIGLVFQDLAIFPHKTVLENVAFGLRMQRVPGEHLKKRVERIMQLVELPPERFGERMPATLSGGEKQRVALARTLVMEPALVLFDEPLVSLDRRLRDRMAVEVRQIQKRVGLPAVYVTHDQESASMLADRIAVMQSGQIIQEGTPLEIYRNPRSRFVADFIGDMNFLSARVVASNDSGSVVEVCGESVKLGTGGLYPGAAVTLAIRPEDLSLSLTKSPRSLSTGMPIGWHFAGGIFIYRMALRDGTEVAVRSASDKFAGTRKEELWVEADSELIRPLKE